MTTENIAKKYLQQAKEITLTYLAKHNQPVEIFLFGSRANGTAHRHSDIDIAYLAKSPINSVIVADLREALEESTIPYTIDLVDLATVNEAFKNKVLKEGIKWTQD